MSENSLTKSLILLGGIFISCLGQAQLGGTTVFNSLNIPSSARVAAVGGNLIAVNDDDINLAIYNPSLLDSAMTGQAALSYVNYFAKTNFGFASYAKHVENIATFGATVQYFNYGKFDETDVNGDVIGEFNAGDIGLTIGAGIPIDTNYSIGANVKVLYSALESYYSVGAAIDLAATYNNEDRRLTAALVMKNIGYQLVAYNVSDREKLPFEIQLGISKRLKHAPFRFSIIAEFLQQWDLTYVNPNEVAVIDPITGETINQGGFEFGDKLMRHMVFGGEILLGDNLSAQFGYNYRTRQEMKISNKPGTAGLSWGLGVGIKRFNFSYGNAKFHLAGASHHFTVTTRLSDW